MAEEHEKGALSRHEPPAHAKHEGGAEHHGGGHHAHVHYHRHDGGVSAHVMHHDGGHEIHHFHKDDHAGMSQLLQEHMGGGAGMPPGEGGAAPGGEPPEHMAQGASPEEEQAEQAA